MSGTWSPDPGWAKPFIPKTEWIPIYIMENGDESTKREIAKAETPVGISVGPDRWLQFNYDLRDAKRLRVDVTDPDAMLEYLRIPSKLREKYNITNIQIVAMGSGMSHAPQKDWHLGGAVGSHSLRGNEAKVPTVLMYALMNMMGADRLPINFDDFYAAQVLMTTHELVILRSGDPVQYTLELRPKT